MCSQVGFNGFNDMGVDFDDKDFVSIYDGPNDKWTRIEELNGYIHSSFVILSTRNSLFVKLESDSDAHYAGFLATIQYGNSYLNIKYT